MCPPQFQIPVYVLESFQRAFSAKVVYSVLKIKYRVKAYESKKGLKISFLQPLNILCKECCSAIWFTCSLVFIFFSAPLTCL